MHDAAHSNSSYIKLNQRFMLGIAASFGLEETFHAIAMAIFFVDFQPDARNFGLHFCDIVGEILDRQIVEIAQLGGSLLRPQIFFFQVPNLPQIGRIPPCQSGA